MSGTGVRSATLSTPYAFTKKEDYKRARRDFIRPRGFFYIENDKDFVKHMYMQELV